MECKYYNSLHLTFIFTDIGMFVALWITAVLLLIPGISVSGDIYCSDHFCFSGQPHKQTRVLSVSVLLGVLFLD